jgi:isopenicillin-N epimerase
LDLKGLFALDPDIAFLNHGSYGACPRAVIEAWQALQWQAEAQPVAFHNPLNQARLHRRTREALAALMNAGAEDLVHAVNATQGLNVAIRSLPLGPGDEVLTTDHEYAALEKTWAVVCAETGAKVSAAQVATDSEDAFLDTLFAAASPRTRVLFLSHITSPTALVFPVARAVAEARARGWITVIDGAHAPGQIPLDLSALGADFYAGNCHKWLMAPKGAGFLHVAGEWQHRVRPAYISHGWEPGGDAQGARGPFGNPAFLDRLEMQGTRDTTAFFAVPAALAFRAEHEWDRVIGDCRVLAQATARRIEALTGFALLSPALCAPQMVTIEIPAAEQAPLHDRLLGEFGIEIPVVRWQGRTFVRLSVQGYTTTEDCDRLVAAIATIFAS